MRTPTRRFEYTQGTSNKFWEVWCVDENMHCRWGRIGGRAQKKTWWYGSVAAARSMASRKSNQKIGKGYVEVGNAVAVRITVDPVAITRKRAARKAGRKKPKPSVQVEAKFKRRGPRIG